MFRAIQKNVVALWRIRRSEGLPMAAWANTGDSGSIGRAPSAAPNGPGQDQEFITEGIVPCGLATNATHVFWGNAADTTVGRANLNGTGAKGDFINDAEGPCGVAVDADPTSNPPSEKPSNEFSFGETKRNKRSGTAKLEVILPGEGEVAMEGSKVKPVSVDVNPSTRASGNAITVSLKVKAKGKAKKKLKTKGKAKVGIEVTYTPTGGDPNTLDKRLKLKKK